jgi:hypothetical protein
MLEKLRGSFNKRILAHRFQINNGGNKLLYFNSPDHSILSMSQNPGKDSSPQKKPNIEYPFP